MQSEKLSSSLQQNIPITQTTDKYQFRTVLQQYLAKQIDQKIIEQFLLKNINLIDSKTIITILDTIGSLHQQSKGKQYDNNSDLIVKKFIWIIVMYLLSFHNPEEYSKRWNNFYQITNWIFKIKVCEDDKRILEKIIIQCLFFLQGFKQVSFLNNNNQIAQKIQQCRAKIQTQLFQRKTQINQSKDSLSQPSRVRIFYSLLCLESINIQGVISLLKIMCEAIEKNAFEFLTLVESKFFKKLSLLRQKYKKYGNKLGQLTLNDIYQIFKMYQLGKSKKNISKQRVSVIYEQDIRNFNDNFEKVANSLEKQTIKSPYALQFVSKQLLQGFKSQQQQKKKILAVCFNTIRQCTHFFFSFLIEMYEAETDEEISQQIFKLIKQESLKYLSISRVKSLLKSIRLNKSVPLNVSLQKSKNIIKLLGGLSKKFNCSDITYKLQSGDTSLMSIKNISKCKSLIFCVDFSTSQKAKLVTFKVAEKTYEIQANYSSETNILDFQIATHTFNRDKKKEKLIIVRQKKIIDEFSYFSITLSFLVKKGVIQFSIDGAYCEAQQKNGKQIDNIEFGSFQGAIKQVYALDQIMDVKSFYKIYLENYRKISKILPIIFSKDKYLFAFQKQNRKTEKKLFWEKQMAIKFIDCHKMARVSFSEALQQLGGLPNLLYLVLMQIQFYDQANTEALIDFYSELFDFLRQLSKQGDQKTVKNWMTRSLSYFGQFLWIVLSRIKAIRQNNNFFNRFIDYFGYFSELQNKEGTISHEQSKINEQVLFLIVINIYMNFQSWIKCSDKIQTMIYQVLSKSIKKQTIRIKLLQKGFYDKIISGIIFFYLQNKSSTNQEIVTKLINIAQRICQSYAQQNINYEGKLLKKHINVFMSLLSFSLRKRKQRSDMQVNIFLMLFNHFANVYVLSQVIANTAEMWPYILFEIGQLLFYCQKNPKLISQLFTLGLKIIIKNQGLIKGLDAFLFRGIQGRKQSQNTLFYVLIRIIKNLTNLQKLYQNIDERIIKTPQRLIQIAINSNQLQKISKQKLLAAICSLDTFELKILFSHVKICDFIENVSQKQDLLPIGIMIISRILKFKILRETTQCFNIFSQWILTQKQYIQPKKAQQKQILPLKIEEPQENKQFQKPLQHEKKQQQYIKQVSQKKQIQEINIGQQTQIDNFSKQHKAYANLLSKTLQDSQYFFYLFKQNHSTDLFAICCLLGIFDKQDSWFQIPIVDTDRIINHKITDLGLLFYIRNPSIDFIKAQFQYWKSRLQFKKLLSEEQKQYKLANCSLNILPVSLALNLIAILLSQMENTKQKTDSFQQPYFLLKKIIMREQFQESLILAIKFMENKKNLENLYMVENFCNQNLKKLVLLSQQIFSSYKKQRKTELQIYPKLIQFLNEFESAKKNNNILKFCKKSTKSLKQTHQSLTQILSGYLSLLNLAFKKIKIEQYNQYKNQQKMDESSKKLNISRKIFQISDIQFYLPYSEFLKHKIHTICRNSQKQSKIKEQRWQKLAENNMFWSANRIMDNQCYQIDQKITGFYRLNIIKAKFSDIPYPRRKSFKLDSFSKQSKEIEDISSFTQKSQNLFNVIEDKSLEMSVHEEEQLQYEMQKKNDKQTLPKFFFYTQYVTQKGVYAGKLYFITGQKINYFLFKCTGYESLPDQTVYKCSTIYHRLEDLNFSVRIIINNHSQILARRYILRHTAIQIFSELKAHFFNFFKKQELQKFFKLINNRIHCVTDVRQEFKKKGFTQKWLTGGLDNFQYLMTINKYSGRTYNDLGQYPVLPWVIINYEPQDSEIDRSFIENPNNLRDLSVPSGKISKKKFEGLRIRCDSIDPEDYQIRFLYGTMYSNPTIIYNLFIRLEPFISLHWDHQGKRIDHADRLFSSIKEQFTTVLSSTSDNKQLTPEFYYWPEFLKNRNKVDLGIRQNKQEVHAVKLPGWAQNPQQFIFKMRQVLESPEITENIHKWIDLIFGYKNPYQVAEDYDNLFHYQTYEHDIFQSEKKYQQIRGEQIAISQFGQIPYHIFTNPHPEKKGWKGLQLDKCFYLRKANNKKISNFHISKEGMILCFQDKVEIFFSDLMTIESNNQTRQFSSSGDNAILLDLNNQIWLTLKDGIFRIFNRKGCLNQHDISAQTYCCMNQYIILGVQSKIVIALFGESKRLFINHRFYGHKSPIVLIKSCQLLDIIVSVDQDGLVMVHQFTKRKLLREFQLGSSSNIQFQNHLQILDMKIHEMGYFIFLTKNQKLIIYTFLGELYLEQDINIIVKGTSELITAFEILVHNRSLLLLGTNKGNIYQTDFIQIKRFSNCYPFKTYSRIKKNVFYSCEHSQKAIKQIYGALISGENTPIYKIMALYDDNSLCCFVEGGKVGEQIKNSKILRNLGLF